LADFLDSSPLKPFGQMNRNLVWPSIDASYQVSYHLAKWFQRKSCFRNRPIRNKNCLWRPCLLADRLSSTEPLVFFAYQFWNLATFSGPPSKLVPHFLVHSYSSANSMHV
jgi:hypothetical protein